MLYTALRQNLSALLGRASYNSDGLIAFHGADFLSDPRFRRSYNEGIARLGTEVHVEWRVRVSLWAARAAMKLDGDFVECGVNTGIMAGAIMDDLNWMARAPRRFWLLDTFEGMPLEGLSAASIAAVEAMNVSYTNVYDVVRQYFSKYPNVTLVRGRVPNTLTEVTADRIAFVSIDMNAPEPEIAAGEYFWPRMLPGAMMVLDDYNFIGCEAQRPAWDQFAARHGIDILPLPTGQGLVVKPPG